LLWLEHLRRLRRLSFRTGVRQTRKEQAHASSSTGTALDGHGSLMTLDDAKDHRQTEAGALANFLGREERVDGLVENLGAHAAAVVLDFQEHVVSRRYTLREGDKLASQNQLARTKGDGLG